MMLPNIVIPTPLHSPHNLDWIQNFLRIGDSQNLEFYVTELNEVEGVVLPGDRDSGDKYKILFMPQVNIYDRPALICTCIFRCFYIFSRC